MNKRLITGILVFLATCAHAQHSINLIELTQDLKILCSDSLEGRKIGTVGNQKARAFIMERLSNLQVSPYLSDNYQQTFPTTQSKPVNGTNILCVIEGRKEETFVISAHYDHLGIINNAVYNGADDNASGTAALLSLIRYFQSTPPIHRLVFAFFDGEEFGLKGSAHFVNSVDLKKERVVLNVNLDMISRSDHNELYVSGTYHYPFLRNHLEHLNGPENVKLVFGHDTPSTGKNDWTSQSDQKNFHQKNIPFVYFGVEDHADYHKPSDDFEKINMNFYAGCVETILLGIKSLDKGLQ